MALDLDRRYAVVSEDSFFQGRRVYATVCGFEGVRRIAVPQGVLFNGRQLRAMAECFEGQLLDAHRVVAIPQGVFFQGRPVYVFACCPGGSSSGSSSSTSKSSASLCSRSVSGGSSASKASGSASASASASGSSAAASAASSAASTSAVASSAASGHSAASSSVSAPGSQASTSSASSAASAASSSSQARGSSAGVSTQTPSTASQASGSAGSASSASSASSSNAASVPTVPTSCCNSVPKTLYGTVSNIIGTCGVLAGTYAFDYDEASTNNPTWRTAVDAIPSTGTCGVEQWAINCQAGSTSCAQFFFNGTGYAANLAPDSCSCSPFELVYSLTPTFCCSGSFTLTITDAP